MARQKSERLPKDLKRLELQRYIYLKEQTGQTFGPGKLWKAGKRSNGRVPIDIILFMYVRIYPSLGTSSAILYRKKWDNLTIRIYPGADADFTLYEDEFDNYNYEKVLTQPS